MAVPDPLQPVARSRVQRQVTEWSGHPSQFLGDSSSARADVRVSTLICPLTAVQGSLDSCNCERHADNINERVLSTRRHINLSFRGYKSRSSCCLDRRVTSHTPPFIRTKRHKTTDHEIVSRRFTTDAKKVLGSYRLIPHTDSDSYLSG